MGGEGSADIGGSDHVPVVATVHPLRDQSGQVLGGSPYDIIGQCPCGSSGLDGSEAIAYLRDAVRVQPVVPDKVEHQSR